MDDEAPPPPWQERARGPLGLLAISLGSALLLSPAAFLASLVTDGGSAERPLRAIYGWPFEALDGPLQGHFAGEMLEATFAPVALVLGFGGVLAWPLLLGAGLIALGRAFLKRRAWAGFTLFAILALLALGSLWTATLPAETFPRDFAGRSLAPSLVERVVEVFVAAAASLGAWMIAPRGALREDHGRRG